MMTTRRCRSSPRVTPSPDAAGSMYATIARRWQGAAAGDVLLLA
jgi:hypothetical protein